MWKWKYFEPNEKKIATGVGLNEDKKLQNEMTQLDEIKRNKSLLKHAKGVESVCFLIWKKIRAPSTEWNYI